MIVDDNNDFLEISFVVFLYLLKVEIHMYFIHSNNRIVYCTITLMVDCSMLNDIDKRKYMM